MKSNESGPVGVETCANSWRLEKSLRLQNADLLTEYNLYEAGLAWPKVKEADFHGKEAHISFRDREHQPAYLCIMTMTNNVDSKSVARYPVGTCPILDQEKNEVIIDEIGRRSYLTSIAYGPSVGKNIALGYLPKDYSVEGRELVMEYFDEPFPIKVEAAGCVGLYDPENALPKT